MTSIDGPGNTCYCSTHMTARKGTDQTRDKPRIQDDCQLPKKQLIGRQTKEVSATYNNK